MVLTLATGCYNNLEKRCIWNMVTSTKTEYDKITTNAFSRSKLAIAKYYGLTSLYCGVGMGVAMQLCKYTCCQNTNRKPPSSAHGSQNPVHQSGKSPMTITRIPHWLVWSKMTLQTQEILNHSKKWFVIITGKCCCYDASPVTCKICYCNCQFCGHNNTNSFVAITKL